MNNKFKIIIIIITLSFILTGCPYCKDSNCKDIIIGRGEIHDTSLLWIPYNPIDTIAFTNTNGFHDLFISNGFVDDSIMLEYSIYDENCGDPMIPCYELFSIPVRRITFYPQSINLPISIEIQKNLSYSFANQSVVSDTVSDIIVIKINKDKRTISTKNQNTSICNTVEHLDSVNINGKTYFNVFHSFQHSNISGISLDGIYYTKNEGIIGFYLTNGEQWFID